MAGKKFDLGEYNIDTSKTQAKHNKYSAFIENETEKPEPISAAGENKKAVVTAYDAQQAKRINMAFTDENYALIAGESERLAVSFVYFISSLIRIVDESDINSHIKAMTIPRSKDNVSRRRGNPAKRINLKFSPELHEILCRGAESHNMTITQYMNTIIEVYAQDKHRINTI